MKILHISDFHFRSDKRNLNKQDKIVAKILESINQSDEIDFITFSGDLVNTGESIVDFDKANDLLLKSLSEKLNLDATRIFVCCGNHDVNRREKTSSVVDFIDKIKSSYELNEFEKNNPKDFQLSCSPIQNFIEFSKKYVHNDLGDCQNELFSTHIRTINNSYKVGIVTINSAWRAVGIEDEGNLVYPSDKLHEALNNINSCDYKILIQHHPLSDFKRFNLNELEDLYYNHFDLYLSGHNHKNKDSVQISAGGGMISVSAPAALSFDYSAEIGYGIINIDFENHEFKITKFLYDRHNDIIYTVDKPKIEIPASEEKRELNRFRKKLRKKFEIELNDANNLFVSLNDDESSRTFLDMCTSPIIKNYPPSEVKVDELNNSSIDWNDLNTPDCDYLILGKDKCGKTVLLKKILIELLLNYPKYEIIPFYFDCKDFNNKNLNLVHEIYRYFEVNKNDVNNFLTEKNMVILIDNYQSKNEQIINELERYAHLENVNIKIIACSDETTKSSIEEIRIDGRLFKKLYFHRLRKKHIKELSNKTYTLPKNKQDEIVNRIDAIFTKLSIPFNFWSVSLFLWIFKKDLNTNIQSDVELINLYIEKLLEKEKLTIERSSFGFEKYKRFLAHLAGELVSKHHETSYVVDYSKLLEITTHYLSKNPRFTIEAREILEYIEARGIIQKKKGDNYSFRLNGVFEYFIAHYMSMNRDYLNEIIEDQSYYLSFSNEFELFAGFNRSDYHFLTKILEKTKIIYNDLHTEHLKNGMSLDNVLKSQIINVGMLKTSISKISKALKDGLTDDEQDAIEEQILIESGVSVENVSEVRKKEAVEISNSIDSLEKALSILGRVYKNIDEINDEDKVYEIFDFVIDSACLWGFKIIEEFMNNTTVDIVENLDSDEAKDLMDLISKIIPTLVQTRLNEFIGHRNLEKIVEKRIQDLKTNSGNNQFKLFLLYFLLCDIDIPKNRNRLKELIEILKMPILKYSSILKLNYYLGFKTNDDKDAVLFFQKLIQLQQISFDNETDLGDLHKGFSEKSKYKAIRKKL